MVTNEPEVNRVDVLYCKLPCILIAACAIALVLLVNYNAGLVAGWRWNTSEKACASEYLSQAANARNPSAQGAWRSNSQSDISNLSQQGDLGLASDDNATLLNP